MELYIWTGLGIIALGLILFFKFISSRKYRDPTQAPNYENIRNKLTIREPEEEETNEDIGDKSITNNLLHLAIGILMMGIFSSIAVVIFTNIGNTLNNSVNSTNIKFINEQLGHSNNGIMNWIPIFVISFIALTILSSFSIKSVLKDDELEDIKPEKDKSNVNIKHYKKMRDDLTRREIKK